MDANRPVHPWVAERHDRITFAVQLISSRESPPGPAIVRTAKIAEDLGLDAVFLGDHPAWAPDSYLHLAAVAATTSRIGLGPMVAAAPYRNPILTARLVSDLDHLSGGRFINGLGIGWNTAEWEMGVNEFDRMGLPYPPASERQAALEEYIEIIRGVWGPAPFAFRGVYYQIEQANVPAPHQKPEPPLCIAGGGAKTLGQVARLADMSNFGSGPAGGVPAHEGAAQRLEILRRKCEEIGRPYEDILRSHFVHWLLLAKDNDALEMKVRHYFPEGPTGFWGVGLIAKTPEEAVAYYQPYVDAGMCYFIFQSLDMADHETLELVMTNVVPRLEAGN
jgi:alkanesulfonate monooxygenase SsuD/methylene tetrahydromethanopterin reductase-like flavin-dependent oxidoreductase (luciferase family)